MRLSFILLILFPFVCRSQSITIASSDTAICVGDTIKFTAVADSATSPHYSWKINGTAAGTDSNILISWALNDNDTVKCVLTNATGDSALAVSNSIVMAVAPHPYAGVITGPSSVCEHGATITLSDTVTGGMWYTASYHTSVLNGVVTGRYADGFECPSPIDDSIFYCVSNACETDTAYKIITVLNFPDPYFETSQIICVRQSLPLSSGVTDYLCDGHPRSTYGFVSVGNDAIYGYKPGDDIITNSATNSCGTASYSMRVTVIGQPTLAIIHSFDSLCVGDTGLIELKATDELGTYCRASSKTEVAMRSNTTARVIGKSAGADTLYMRAESPCGYDEKMVLVTIKPSPVKIMGMDSLCKGYTTLLVDSTKGGTWTSNDETVATADSLTGIITARDTGIARIQYMLQGCASSLDMKVNDCSEVEIYPNPTDGDVTIHRYTDKYKTYELIDMLGQTITTQLLTGVFTKVHLKSLRRGMYFIKVSDNRTSNTYKIIRR